MCRHTKAQTTPLIKSSLQKSLGKKNIDQRGSQGAYSNSGGAAEIQSSEGRVYSGTAMSARSTDLAFREDVAIRKQLLIECAVYHTAKEGGRRWAHGVSIIMWGGCFSSAWTVKTFSIEEDRGSHQTQEIQLEAADNLRQGRTFTLQTDNNPKYTARATMERFKAHSWVRMAQSKPRPTLYPIVNLWQDFASWKSYIIFLSLLFFGLEYKIWIATMWQNEGNIEGVQILLQGTVDV